MIFGIYPGGPAGSDTGIATGPSDRPDEMIKAIRLLRGESSPFIVRAYCRYSDDGLSQTHPEHFEQYMNESCRLDLVVMFQSAQGNVAAYVDFVRSMVQTYGAHLYALQVTEEANFTSGPSCIDGSYPNVLEALVEGVRAAKEEALRQGHLDLKIGFNATPTFGPAVEFWSSIGAIGGKTFVDSLDYVGLDFFPDVFRPVAPDGEPGDLRESVLVVLEAMCGTWLPAAGIPASIPIHITEHGWPTGPERSCERQGIVLEQVIRTIHEARERLNIERYTMFSLRDANSAKVGSASDLFYHFGIMRDDYTPKPAFEVYRKLIAELTCGLR